MSNVRKSKPNEENCWCHSTQSRNTEVARDNHDNPRHYEKLNKELRNDEVYENRSVDKVNRIRKKE